jgi:Methyltransferase domain
MGQEKTSAPWPPATFTAALRQSPASLDPAQRQERALRHEASLAFRVTKAVARVPVLGSLLGARPAPASRYQPAAGREAEIERITEAPLYRRVEALRTSRAYERLWTRGVRRRRDAPGPASQAAAPAPAELGKSSSRQVDEALSFLRTIPFQELQRRGWNLQPSHFYWPLNDVEFLRDHPELWHDRGLPAGVSWELDAQLDFVRALAPFCAELADIADRPAAVDMGSEITLVNGSFSGADACAYYGLVRKLQPRRVVEVGAGWSSVFLAHALARNERPAEVTLIEPEPNRRLLDRLPRNWEVRQALLQLADMEPFTRLEAGDVCFYDGSHCVHTASDVNWFFFEVLPRLAPGVMVHVHDIFLPDDYHDQWLLGDGLSWNEQYFLQAFLMHNDAYRVRLANHMLFRLREDDVRPLYPGWPDGGSVWIEKVAS